MKACPFCAEEIQDAAIVCKHCRTSLLKPGPRWGRILLVVLGLMVGGLWLVDQGLGRDPAYMAFKAQRTAWHARCDAYQAAPTHPIARACTDELNAMVASAKQHGWHE